MRRQSSSQYALIITLVSALTVFACGKDDDAASEAEASEGTTERPEGNDEGSVEVPTGDKEGEPAAKAKPEPAPAEAADDKKVAKTKPAPDGAQGEVAADAPNEQAASDGGADKAALLSPAERRKAERERRIAELKRRNEERRAAKAKGVEPPKATAPEAPSAAKAAEVKEQAASEAATKPKGLNIARFLSLTEVRKITGRNTLQPGDPLAGRAPSQRYNSLYFTPADRTAFGLSLQFWKEETRRDANERFRRMREQYPNSENASAPTAKSFYSLWDDILSLTFADLTKRVVITVSCSKAICSPENLLDVSKLVQGKL